MHLAGRRVFHISRRILAAASPSSGQHQRPWLPSAILSAQSVEKTAHFHPPMCVTMGRNYSVAAADTASDSVSGVVREMYDKMLKKVEGKAMPPNAWLWSLISGCSTKEDVTLLFKMLERLRIFRLSSLRIHNNFNENLCRSVAEACARSGAIEYGMKTLWKHNIYGLTPNISSAHHLLLYARKEKDLKLMVEVMKLLKKNGLPLQPGTADIVFSICSDLGEWVLLKKYAMKFSKGGVKLRRTSFGTWMEFAARRGDLESLWKIEKLRSKTVNQHNLATGFSCAKGYLLEGKPDAAAAVIHLLYQNLREELKPTVVAEMQKLTSEWPLDFIKQQNKEDRKAIAASLRSEIKKMVGCLSILEEVLSVRTDNILLEDDIPS